MGKKEDNEEYKIIDFATGDIYNKRYAISDSSGKVIDDAQGYGYKSKEKASKALWFKFKGGKDKLNKEKKEFNNWLKTGDNKKIQKSFNNYLESYFKEIYHGEITVEDVFKMIEGKFETEIPEIIKKYL